MKQAFMVAAAFLFIINLLGCEKIDTFKTSPTTEAKPPIKINGPLLARVNDWAIGLDDFKNYLNSLKPLAERQKLNIDSTEFKVTFLNDLIKAQILAQIAIERGLDKDADVQRALRDTRDTLLAAKIRDEIEKNVSVPYAEVKNFYDKNKHLLKKPQDVKVSEIAVPSEALAKEIYVKLLQGETFDTLARQYSVVASKDQGGSRGWLTPSQDDIEKHKKFWAALVTLDKGQTSTIFKGDDNNYYIVKIDDIRGGQEVPLTEVEEDLRKALKADKIDLEEKQLIDKFKEKTKIEKNEDLLK
jgi:peptidyl-prolyl cis-trans isomerase C